MPEVRSFASLFSRSELDLRGVTLVRSVLADQAQASLLNAIPEAHSSSGVRTRGHSAYAARNLLWDSPEIARLLTRFGIDEIATEALGKPGFPINATFFDKTADANWKVPPYQDLMMPVETRAHSPGFDGWTTKLGILYVEPPRSVLEALVALRIHFDDCSISNGPLSIVPGSHRRGKLKDADILLIPTDSFVPCVASAGDVLLMKPLLVHRSSPSDNAHHRRILHVVYAAEHPAHSLRWKTPMPVPTP